MVKTDLDNDVSLDLGNPEAYIEELPDFEVLEVFLYIRGVELGITGCDNVMLFDLGGTGA
jgi:hypothetical protein